MTQNENLNQNQKNSLYSQKGNLMDTKTISLFYFGVVIFVAFIAGGLILLLSNNLFSDIFLNFSEIEVIKPLEKLSIDTSDWITYKNEEIGIELKHPKGIFVVEKEEFLGNPKFQYVGYFNYPPQEGETIMPFNFSKFFSPLKIYFYSADFKPSRGFTYNKKPIDVNWTLEEFVENMNIPFNENFSIPFIKKLDDKSLLLIHCICLEGSSFPDIYVLSPLNERYPNLVIDIFLSKEEDELLSGFFKREEELNFKEECEKFAQRVFNGMISSGLKNKIKIAQMIANSVKVLDSSQEE